MAGVMKRSHLYVIGHPSGALKIGVARNPLARLEQLQIASPVRLAGRFFAACAAGEARRIEMRAHQILSGFRQEGEWFKVSLQEAEAAIRQAANDLGCELVEGISEAHGAASDVASESMISPLQCRGARGMLGISQEELAKEVGISDRTIHSFEKNGPIAVRTVIAIRSVLEARGARFVEANGRVGVLVAA